MYLQILKFLVSCDRHVDFYREVAAQIHQRLQAAQERINRMRNDRTRLSFLSSRWRPRRFRNRPVPYASQGESTVPRAAEPQEEPAEAEGASEGEPCPPPVNTQSGDSPIVIDVDEVCVTFCIMSVMMLRGVGL